MAAPPTLETARAAFDGGRFDIALQILRALPEVLGDSAERAEIARLRCMSAYRLGELDEAATLVSLIIDPVGSHADDAGRFDMLAIGVVAAGELARFDEAIEHLRRLLSLATRAGTLASHVRGRGSVAICFALLGDAWAGQRLLAELIGLFQGLPEQLRLEATARNNHTSVCLQLVRLATQGGDAAGAAEAMDHAQSSLDRCVEIASTLNDPRLKAFANVHQGEVAMMRGDPAHALALLTPAAAEAESTGLWAHCRQLNLLMAEARLTAGDSTAALTHLDKAGARLGEGHEIGLRIRVHSGLHRAWAARGDSAQALGHLERARELAQYRQYRQMQAQSRFLRTRLEFEHLYPFRGKPT